MAALTESNKEAQIKATMAAIREINYRLSHPSGSEAYSASRSYYEQLKVGMMADLEKLTRFRDHG